MFEIGFSFLLFFMPKARKNEPIPGSPGFPRIQRILSTDCRPAPPQHAPGVRMTWVHKQTPSNTIIPSSAVKKKTHTHIVKVFAMSAQWPLEIILATFWCQGPANWNQVEPKRPPIYPKGCQNEPQEGREGFKKVPGGRRIRSGRVSAQTEPRGPDSRHF